MQSVDISDIVLNLYACVAEADAEVLLLDTLCSVIGLEHAIAMRTSSASVRRYARSNRAQSLTDALLNQIGTAPEYRSMISGITPGHPKSMTDIVPMKDLLRTQAYQEVLRPIDGGLSAFAWSRDGDEDVVVVACRSVASGKSFDARSLALLKNLLPHFVTASGAAATIRTERIRTSRMVSALDAIPDGVVMIGADGRVCHVNARAEILLAAGDRVRSVGSVLVAVDPIDDRAMQGAVRSARALSAHARGKGDAEFGSGQTQIVVGRSRPGWPLVVTVMPSYGLTEADPRAPAVVVRLSDPSPGPCMSADTLIRHFGLTPREAALACGLGSGLSLADAARDLGLTTGTARQYLKVVFEKVGVHSQSELLRIVCR